MGYCDGVDHHLTLTPPNTPVQAANGKGGKKSAGKKSPAKKSPGKKSTAKKSPGKSTKKTGRTTRGNAGLVS